MTNTITALEEKQSLQTKELKEKLAQAQQTVIDRIYDAESLCTKLGEAGRECQEKDKQLRIVQMELSQANDALA